MSTVKRLVLAFSPTTRGYAFVLFEGPQSPYDWGVRDLHGPKKNARTMKAFKRLIDRYSPETLVIEKMSRVLSRKSDRIKRLHRMLLYAAKAEQMEVMRYTRTEIRGSFAPTGAVRKEEIAHAVAAMIPAFAHWLPPKRKVWMGEHRSQGLFDAAALGLTYYAREDAGSIYPDTWKNCQEPRGGKDDSLASLDGGATTP